MILTRPEHPLKAPSPILDTELGIIMFVMLEQSSKAELTIDSQFSFTTQFVISFDIALYRHRYGFSLFPK